MQKKGHSSLVEIFSTARGKILHTARKNFEYVYKNGGYSPEDLVDVFHQTMPVIKWDRTVVFHFLHPKKSGHNVALRSAGLKDIARFLEKSIELREQVQNEFKAAEAMIRDSHAKWGDYAHNPPQRQTIIENIRTNFRYIHENNGCTLEQLAALFNKSYPAHSWDKSSVRRFLYPEKIIDGKGTVQVTYGSSNMLSDLLKVSIDERTRAMDGFSSSPEGPP